MPKKLTKEEFIERARKVHGDKYDYSKVEYNGNRNSITIICPIHGEFEQIAGDHLRGCGCSRCNGQEILNKEDFIKKAHEKFGDKYDYTKVEYNGTKNKVIITCRKHGDFEITPVLHLKYGGCPKCRHEKKVHSIERDDFIEQSKKVHGDKYDYSNVPETMEYYDTEVSLICPVHGEFRVTPYEHINLKRGCVKCNFRGLSSEEWVERFKMVHGDRYDYSKFEYKGSDVKSTIICKKHGEFEQTPGKHVNGVGCPKCKCDKLHELNCKTTEQFIKEARAIHGDKYDYSKVQYKTNKDKVCIICPEHGEFWQLPTTHVQQGSGCKKCATIADTPRKRDTIETFIRKANKTHNDKYDYHKVEYIDSQTPVCIICPEHGEFWQRPDSHISGQGCPKCGKHKTEELMCKYLDELGINYEYEKSFKWLFYKGMQRLDFYLPDANIAIERQGEGHSLPIDFGGKGKEQAEKDLKHRIKLDENKKRLCDAHGVKIYYIEYYEDFKKHIDEILSENNLLKSVK